MDTRQNHRAPLAFRRNRIAGPQRSGRGKPGGPRQVRLALRYVVDVLRLKIRLARRRTTRVIIGASGTIQEGWISTNSHVLDLLRPAHWRRLFRPASVDAMLAEHVWEHLTPDQGLTAAKTCFEYLKPGGYIRIAVPDGLHPDPDYIRWVDIDGVGPAADDHKVLYKHETLRDVFERAGFRVVLHEYFDTAGTFHYQDWDPADGKVYRSKRFDARNEGNRLNYTSIVLDAIKD